MKVEAREDGGRGVIQVTLDIGAGLGDIDLARIDEHDVHVLAPNVSLTWLKLNEADYFLTRLEAHLGNVAATLYHFNAFAAAMKSLPKVLHYEARGKPGFQDWEREVNASLRKDPDYSRLVKLRDRGQHLGIVPPQMVIGLELREHLDGRVTASGATLVGLIGVGGEHIEDALGVLRRALATVRTIVEDGEQRGYVERTRKQGHRFHIRLLKEVRADEWQECNAQDMDLFGKQEPKLSVEPSVDGVPGWVVPSSDDGKRRSGRR